MESDDAGGSPPWDFFGVLPLNSLYDMRLGVVECWAAAWAPLLFASLSRSDGGVPTKSNSDFGESLVGRGALGLERDRDLPLGFGITVDLSLDFDLKAQDTKLY